MDTLTIIIDFTSLSIQLIGTWIMFKNSPDNKPEGVVFLKGWGDIDYDEPKRKNKKFKNGFLILGIGFILAFISLLLKTFVSHSI
jgi:hypothetical protein